MNLYAIKCMFVVLIVSLAIIKSDSDLMRACNLKYKDCCISHIQGNPEGPFPTSNPTVSICIYTTEPILELRQMLVEVVYEYKGTHTLHVVEGNNLSLFR